MTFCNFNLRMNNINSCNHFSNRMFYLNTRIYFNEVKLIT